MTSIETPLMPVRDPKWSRVNKLAWLRVGAIGDLLVGTAALAELPHFFPHAKVTVIGPRLWAELLSPSAFPYVEKLIAIERKETSGQAYVVSGDAWVPDGAQQPLADLLARYDALVNTNIDSLRYGFTALRAGVPMRIGSASGPMAWLYTHNAPHFGKDPLVHERDIALLLTELATPCWKRVFRTVNRNRARLPAWLSASRSVADWRVKGLPPLKPLSRERARALAGAEPGAYVLINPTASRREKTWPTDRMRALLDECAEELRESGLEPLVIGAPSEGAWLGEVAGDRWRILQPPDLSSLQDIVYGARLLLTNGSSMQFIAGTTGTPVLTIFGRGQPVIWGPVGEHDRFVRASFAESGAGSTFAGFETEAETYRSISVADVRTPFMHMTRKR